MLPTGITGILRTLTVPLFLVDIDITAQIAKYVIHNSWVNFSNDQLKIHEREFF